MTKVYTGRQRTTLRAPYRITRDTLAELHSIQSDFAELLGREVSLAIIVARAVEALKDRTAAAKGDADKLGVEVVALARHF